jgi:hypothetical protein
LRWAVEATAEKSGGRITELRIGDRCVAMMRGVLELQGYDHPPLEGR